MFYLHYSLLEKGILSTFVVFICVNQIVIEHRLICDIKIPTYRYAFGYRYRFLYIDVTVALFLND